jgi:manganese-transporting P-type ATPase
MGIKPYPVYTYRCNRWEEVLTDELFPGDLISIVRTKEDSGLPCDAILLSGGCIVNEAMLSGESTPLLKESVALRPENDTLDTAGLDKNSLLYGGTKVLQTTPPTEQHDLHAPDDGVLAVVTRTGFETSQGSLVRTMIYSTERVSANNFESLLFILFLLVFAVGASWYVWVEGTPPASIFNLRCQKRSKTFQTPPRLYPHHNKCRPARTPHGTLTSCKHLLSSPFKVRHLLH